MAFDCLFYKGEDIRTVSLLRDRLSKLYDMSIYITYYKWTLTNFNKKLQLQLAKSEAINFEGRKIHKLDSQVENEESSESTAVEWIGHKLVQSSQKSL